MNQALSYNQYLNVTRIDAYRAKRQRIDKIVIEAYDHVITNLVDQYGNLTAEMCGSIEAAITQAAEQAVANDTPAPERQAIRAGFAYYNAFCAPDGAA